MPSIIKIPPLDTKIFHYRSIHEFVSILQSKSLRFTNLPHFKRDPVEARFSGKVGKLEDFPDVDLNVLMQRLIENSYAHCWTIDNEPSDLMWLAYAPHLGVAIESSVGRLMQCFESPETLSGPLTFGEVSYNKPTVGNIAFWKRTRFKREKEFRVVNSEQFYSETYDNDDASTARWAVAVTEVLDPNYRKNKPASKAVKVRLDDLITKVWVSPHDTPAWFLEVVKRELKQYGHPNIPVEADTLG